MESFVIDFDLNLLDWEAEERKRIQRELADEADAEEQEEKHAEEVRKKSIQLVHPKAM